MTDGASPLAEPTGPRSAFPEVLTTALAAELLHVNVEYLRKMVREGRIPAHRPFGREIRFLRDELIEWVRGRPAARDAAPSGAEPADLADA